MKVAVIGATGFLGKKVCDGLLNKKLHVKAISRNDLSKGCYEGLLECDFCFHLAGEVRPNATTDDFHESNVRLTEIVLNTLRRNSKKPPVLFASTIHASNPKNDYGYSKLDAENLIREYYAETKSLDFIFRLPHLFGTGGKPQHNSVFTTWVYNAVQGKSLNVFDPSIHMNYIQVDELASMMIRQIGEDTRLILPSVYSITLGELKERILFLYNSGSPKDKLDKYIIEMLMDASKNILDANSTYGF